MWTFSIPVKVSFGAGSATQASAIVAQYGKYPVIVTDRILAVLPMIQKIIRQFPGVSVFSDVEPNPTVANVDALALLLRDCGADVVLAIGGGSALDCAKAASCLVCSGEMSIRAFHSEGVKLGSRHLPVVAMPTTAGTGAEVTPFSVLDDQEKGIKGPIAADALYPVQALVDPELTCTLPLYVTACTGLDALCHAIEGYWSKNHQPICDLLAQEAARLIFAHFERACIHPEDMEARTALSYAALIAGMAFQLPKNAMVHACSYPLSTRFHLPHGAACAFTLEFAISLNTPVMGGRMEAFAAYCGFEDVSAMVERIRVFKRLGGLPCTLVEAGIAEEDISGLIEGSFHPLMNNNPKTVTREDLQAMYTSLRK
jgi:alcohol dehydrogenase